MMYQQGLLVRVVWRCEKDCMRWLPGLLSLFATTAVAAVETDAATLVAAGHAKLSRESSVRMEGNGFTCESVDKVRKIPRRSGSTVAFLLRYTHGGASPDTTRHCFPAARAPGVS